MIQAFRYLLAFPLCLLYYGGQVIIAALIGVRSRRGGIYDRASHRFGKRLCDINGVRVVVEGRERLRDDRPCVYIANHVSFVDIWVLLRELPGSVRFVFKKELLEVPIFGRALVAAGHIRIDRQNRAAAFAAYDHAAAAIRAGTSAVVFAEGTRSRDGRLQPFKKGPFVLAIAAQVPVVPVFISGSYALMPPGARYPARGTVTIKVGEALPTAGLDHEDRNLLTSRAHEAMRALAGLVEQPGMASPRP